MIILFSLLVIGQGSRSEPIRALDLMTLGGGLILQKAGELIWQIRCECDFSGRDLELLGTALERLGTVTPKRASRTEKTVAFSLDAVMSGCEVRTVVVV